MKLREKKFESKDLVLWVTLAALLLVVALGVTLKLLNPPEDTGVDPLPENGVEEIELNGEEELNPGEEVDNAPRNYNDEKEQTINTAALEVSPFVKEIKNDFGTFKLYEDYAVLTLCGLSTPEITVPDKVEDLPVARIEKGAFQERVTLTKIHLPEGLAEIGDLAFSGCTALTSVTLPDTLYSIGENAFFDCTALQTVEMTRGVKVIAPNAFDKTPYLTENREEFMIAGDGILLGYHGGGGDVTLPAEVKKISSFSANMRLTGLYASATLEEIDDYAFALCTNLATLRLSQSVKYIGTRAFSCCEMLTDVRLEEGLITLGDGAFADCYNLQNVLLPASLTNIGEGLFEGVKEMKAINVTPDSVAHEFFMESEYKDLVVAEEA